MPRSAITGKWIAAPARESGKVDDGRGPSAGGHDCVWTWESTNPMFAPWCAWDCQTVSNSSIRKPAARAEMDCRPTAISSGRRKTTALRAFFINQIGGLCQEKERAWGRYHLMQDFVKGKQCRQKQICEYFGETVKWTKMRSLRRLCGAAVMDAYPPGAAAPKKETGRRVKPRNREIDLRSIQLGA